MQGGLLRGTLRIRISGRRLADLASSTLSALMSGVMTVCANAADETVKAAIAAGKQTGIKVVTDMIGVKDIAARACVVAHWGVDMLYLHYAADQRRADGARDSTQWLEAVLAVTDVPVGLATFGVEDAVRAVKGGARLVAIGHPLFESADVLGALKHYVEQVKVNYQPGK
jgi:3-hexulose-6-phosphate synthase